ncbi:MAG: DNA primase [Syntrophomonadaceae bacterium]|nr:DNA primase [Syntrophomonadaceae bacterium]
MTRGFDDELIREIESRVDIVDIIGERVELTRKGNRYWGLCPFHSEKTPSFSVSQERQLYYCFGCHQGGNIFSFLRNNDKLDFREAVQLLAQKAGLDISRYQTASSSASDRQDSAIIEINQEAARFYHELLKSRAGTKAMNYLTGRHINQDSIEKFYLGYAPDDWRQLEEHLLARGFSIENITESGLVKRSRNADLYMDFLRNRIVFPIYDQRGRVIGFGGRLLAGDGPKYLNSQEGRVFSKRSNLFGLFQGRDAIRSSTEVILVEGYMDCISLHQHGISNAVATLGTALTRQQAKLLKRFTEMVILMYDGDEAGQRETLRALSIIREEGLDSMVVPLPPSTDPDDLVRKQGKEEFLNFIQNNKCTVAEYKIEKHINSGLPLDLDGRIEILWNVFPEVDRIKSVIAREQQTNNLAHRLNLPEGDVKKEFQLW